jgi:pimeloyl-ACP methyl ester carboxylesterase
VKFLPTFVSFLIAMYSVVGATLTAPAHAEAVLQPCVILLHGLARSSASMKKLDKALSKSGYLVRNTDYPSTRKSVDDLAAEVITTAVESCNEEGDRPIHFVTHSLGGILIRYFLETNVVDNLGRVVMLSPPNQGSEAVDKLSDMPGFAVVNGPAGKQLGTGQDDVPSQLGPATFDVGIITGNRSINLFLSMMIPGEDDGKVSVERAKLEGMSDFLVVPHTHPFIMKSKLVIRQVIYFLEHGRFEIDEPGTD